MELFKIHFNKPDNSKTVVKYYMYVLKQIVYNHARISRVACGQVPPLLSKNQRRGVCDSPLVIVYGGHVIFPGICGK